MVSIRPATRYPGVYALIDSDRLPFERDLIEAWGTGVVKAVLDFNDEPMPTGATPGGGWPEFDSRFTISRIGDSTFGPLAGEAGGVAKALTGANNGDGINAQFGTDAFKLTGSNYLHYSVRYRLDDDTASDFFLGLALPESDILGAPATDLLGFRKAAGSTDVDIVARQGAEEVSVAGVMTQDVGIEHYLQLFWDGPNYRVYFYVDGEETTRLSSFANVPFGVTMHLSIAHHTGENVAHYLVSDGMRVIQLGRL